MEVKADSFIVLVLVNHLLLQQLIKIRVLQHLLPQSGRLQKYGDKKLVETRSKFVIFLHVRRSDLRFVTWFMSILKFGLPRLSSEVLRTKRKTELFRAISGSSKSKIKNNGFECLISMQTCQRNQVLNYASETVWALSSYYEPS